MPLMVIDVHLLQRDAVEENVEVVQELMGTPTFANFGPRDRVVGVSRTGVGRSNAMLRPVCPFSKLDR